MVDLGPMKTRNDEEKREDSGESEHSLGLLSRRTLMDERCKIICEAPLRQATASAVSADERKPEKRGAFLYSGFVLVCVGRRDEG